MTKVTKSTDFFAGPLVFLLEHSSRFLTINYVSSDDYGPAGGRGSRLAAPAGPGSTPLARRALALRQHGAGHRYRNQGSHSAAGGANVEILIDDGLLELWPPLDVEWPPEAPVTLPECSPGLRVTYYYVIQHS